MVERYTEARGVKKGHLIEEALLHHLQALRELPADINHSTSHHRGRADSENTPGARREPSQSDEGYGRALL